MIPTARWSIRSGNVIGAGATREGNRGTIPDAYVTWTWNASGLTTTGVVTLTTLDANGRALTSAKVKFWVLR